MQVSNSGLPFDFEARKVQDTMRCAMISIRKRFANKLRIAKGDLVKIQLLKQDSHLDGSHKIVISKVNV